MAPSRQILKMLYVGQDTDFRNDLKKGITALSMPWKVLSCCPTRIAAPEVKIRSYDIIVVHWKSAFRQVSQDGAPSSRSPQGVVHAILEQVDVAEVKKIVVIGESFSREATIFLAENEVTRTYRSSDLKGKEDPLADVKSFLSRCVAWQKENHEYFQSDEAKTLKSFHRVMTEWDNCSDQERMRTMEDDI